MVKIVQDLISESKYPVQCPYYMTPEYITIHNTANDASALNEIAYMKRNSYNSYHYAVDDVEARQGLPLDRNNFSCGDGANGTGNRKSIAIEICYSKSGGARYVQAEENCVQLVAYLLKKYGLGVDRVKKHQDWSGKYCLPLDCTELLTPEGWKQLADINVGDIVAQYENGQIEFVKVQNVVEPYESEVLKVYKTEATPDHRMWCKQSGNKYKTYDFKIWGDILSKSTWYNIPSSGYYEAKGLNLSDEELLLLVWIQGDGHYMKRAYKDGEHYLGIEFHLSKERKINRLIELLEEANYKYSCNIQKDGTTKIRLFGAKYVEHFEEYLTNKCFDYNLLEMNEHQFDLFINELLIVDGCKENNSYCTTIQQNYDVIQALCSINGVRTNQVKTGNSTALTITDRNLSFSGTQDIEKRKTLVSCVTVPSGKILIRQYGQPKIVGNCPHRILAENRWKTFKNRIRVALNGGEPSPTPTPDPGPAGTFKKGDRVRINTAGHFPYYIADDVQKIFGLWQVREDLNAGGEARFAWKDNGIPEKFVDIVNANGKKVWNSDLIHMKKGYKFVFNRSFRISKTATDAGMKYYQLDAGLGDKYKFWVVGTYLYKV